MKGLKVGINARLLDGAPGGVQQVVMGLAAGLSALKGPEEYHFLVYPGQHQWLRPFLGSNCRLLEGGTPPTGSRGGVKKWLGWARPVYRGIKRWTPLSRRVLRPEASDFLAERAGIQVIHFPFQEGFLTRLPSLYQPHDLQHRHYPRFFTRLERRRRDSLYQAYSRQSRFVVLMSRWGRRDFLGQYPDTDPEKVRVVPGAAILSAYPRPKPSAWETFRRKHQLPEKFLYYPAQTFPHKNHLALLQAMDRLARRGLPVFVVFSGRMNDHYPVIQREVERLGLRDQVRFLGFVPPVEIQMLYQMATAMVFPSLFEGWGLPVTEAFHAGLPVASSTATCLPEQAGDAALYFDPASPGEIAAAMQRLWTEPRLRAELSRRGRRQLARYRWEKTALIFRSLYRQAAGMKLSREDRHRALGTLAEGNHA
jgi:glycosyltransferase involved in cell wall biosynthesis